MCVKLTFSSVAKHGGLIVALGAENSLAARF